jgi:DNA-directed RNA polymerase subunit RPC12/RpoP
VAGRRFEEELCCRRRRDSLPAKTLAKLEMCPVFGCGREVANMAKHHKRNHEVKTWGYECECGYQASLLDHTLFLRHRREKHDDDAELSKADLTDKYKIAVPDGYTDMLRCQHCNWRSFTQPQMDAHDCKPDPEHLKKQKDVQLEKWS